MHVIDTPLEPDDSSIEPEALAAALSKVIDNVRKDVGGATTSTASRFDDGRCALLCTQPPSHSQAYPTIACCVTELFEGSI